MARHLLKSQNDGFMDFFPAVQNHPCNLCLIDGLWSPPLAHLAVAIDQKATVLFEDRVFRNQKKMLTLSIFYFFFS